MLEFGSVETSKVRCFEENGKSVQMTAVGTKRLAAGGYATRSLVPISFPKTLQ